MIQSILTGALALIAVVYLMRLVYRSFTSSTCETGCSGCSAVDVNAILDSIEKKKANI